MPCALGLNPSADALFAGPSSVCAWLPASRPRPPPQPGPLALEDEGETLRELAADVGLGIGSALSPRAFFSGFDQDYLTLFERHFSNVTPEYGLYMSHTQPAPGDWQFTEADTVVAFAEGRGLTLRGHALVWGVPRRHDLFGDEGPDILDPNAALGA